MVQSQYSLSWDSYKSNICDGLSALQQNEEFVDMTLAADGHFVKVHQILIALSSPYLKSLISSAPCQHPVIFLNNISYKNLCSVLEYIYTGEVHMPSEDLAQFIETAKSLHIKGLDGVIGGDSLQTTSKIEDSNFVPMGNIKNLSVSTSGRNEQISLPLAARKIQFKNEAVDTSMSLNQPTNRPVEVSKPDFHDYANVPFTMDDGVAHESDDNADKTKSVPDISPNLQFTVSIRGSLQIILNRFIYSVQSTAHKTGVRRWRCIDYRSNKCMAFVVTKGNVVLNRCNPHNHSFHDKKILSKLEKKCVYSVLEDIKDYKENDKEDSRDADDMAMDEDFPYDETMKLSENNET